MADKNRGIKRKHSGVLSEAPKELVVFDFVESRVQEIEALSHSVDSTDGNKKLTQRLPRHMRRRAMSHNIKRLPQRFRDMVKSEYANQGGVKKVPSRRHRRRPKNLLEEYNRRQRKQIWMETHIWHAKRFHMTERWGFKLPLKPTAKGGRASFRATQQYCLLQDMSYLCCIEVKGEEERLLNQLSHLTSTAIGPTFAAKSTRHGTKEGHLMLYQKDSYPWNAIGPVSFLWKPIHKDENKRILWIWCHCSCVDKVWKQLLKCFNLMETSQKDTTLEKEEIEDNANDASAVRKYLCGLTAADEHVTMTSLAGSLLRFRLTGPLSNAVLADCLQQAEIVPSKATENQTTDSAPWWKSYFEDRDFSMGHTHQREMMEHISHCQSPAELSPHCVVGMTVQDPRISRPETRLKVNQNSEPEPSESRPSEQITPSVSASAIWEPEICGEVKKTKTSDHQLNLLKSEQLVPGTGLDLGDRESRVPIILIQQSGIVGNSTGSQFEDQSFIGYGSGWDLVLPSGWGMPFWLSLVFRGARTGGLVDNAKLAEEGRTLLFPNDFPDTESCQKFDEIAGNQLLQTYKRKPPAKRPNYVKLGVVSPFIYPWQKLIHCQPSTASSITKDCDGKESSVSKSEGMEVDSSSTGSEKENSFYVLRDRKVLRQLQDMLTMDSSCKRKGQNRNVSSQKEQMLNMLLKLSSEYRQGLAAVQVDLLLKGNPCQFTMICIPDTDDLEMLQKDKEYGGPLESLHEDTVKKEMKAQKKIIKSGLLKNTEKMTRPDPPISCSDITDQAFTDSTSRSVIGYLTRGGALLSNGNGGGKGFCSIAGLCRLLQRNLAQPQVLVLLRNPTSLQYRFAKLSLMQTS